MSHLDQDLQNGGIDVIHVSTVREAREAMTAVVFPIVLIDDAIGDDAVALIAELRRRYERHRVHLTLIVEDGSPSHLERALLAGADDTLNKHTSAATLLRHLRMAMSRTALNVR